MGPGDRRRPAQRQRQVRIYDLVWVLVLGIAGGRKRTLAGRRRRYERVTGQTIEESSFYKRFSPGPVQPLASAAVCERPLTPATLSFDEQRGCLSDAWMARVPPENVLKVNLGRRRSMFAFLARRQMREPDVDVVPLGVVAENNAPLAHGQPVTEELDTAGTEHPPDVADCYGFNRCMRVDDKRRPAAAAFVGRMPPMMRGQDRAGRATVPTRVGRAAHIALKERSPRPLGWPRPYENGPGRTDAVHSNPPLDKRTRWRPARVAIMCDWLPLEPTWWIRRSGIMGVHPSGAHRRAVAACTLRAIGTVHGQPVAVVPDRVFGPSISEKPRSTALDRGRERGAVLNSNPRASTFFLATFDSSRGRSQVLTRRRPGRGVSRRPPGCLGRPV